MVAVARDQRLFIYRHMNFWYFNWMMWSALARLVDHCSRKDGNCESVLVIANGTANIHIRCVVSRKIRCNFEARRQNRKWMNKHDEVVLDFVSCSTTDLQAKKALWRVSYVFLAYYLFKRLCFNVWSYLTKKKNKKIKKISKIRSHS